MNMLLRIKHWEPQVQKLLSHHTCLMLLWCSCASTGCSFWSTYPGTVQCVYANVSWTATGSKSELCFCSTHTNEQVMSTGVTENQANIRSWLRHHQDPQFPISAAFVKYFAQQLPGGGLNERRSGPLDRTSRMLRGGWLGVGRAGACLGVGSTGSLLWAGTVGETTMAGWFGVATAADDCETGKGADAAAPLVPDKFPATKEICYSSTNDGMATLGERELNLKNERNTQCCKTQSMPIDRSVHVSQEKFNSSEERNLQVASHSQML